MILPPRQDCAPARWRGILRGVFRLTFFAALLYGCSPAPAPEPPPASDAPPPPRAREATEAIRQYVSQVLELYRRDHRTYPTTLQGLEVLFVRKPGRPPYLEGTPPVLDGWGRTLQYSSDGTRFTLSSAGADGIHSTPDDVGGSP